MGETERSQQMRQMLEEYKTSGLSRREFCQQRSIPVTTFDYWRGKDGVKFGKPVRGTQLVKVEVAASEITGQFTLSLANGRRIESSWRFAEADLARLIRIAESA